MKKVKINILEKCDSCGHKHAPKMDPCSSAAPLPSKKMPNAHNQEEARMHRTTLAHLIADVKVLLDLVNDGDDLPEWLETKITKAGDYMSSAARYMAGNVARDMGQLEEQDASNDGKVSVPFNIEAAKLELQKRLEALQTMVSNASSEEQVQSALNSIPATNNIGENITQEKRFAIIEDFFGLYENLKDAIDEDNEKPCPECLFEVLVEASCGCPDLIPEAKYRGRTVKLNKPMRGDVKKFKVYVKDPKTGNIKKVNFGHGGSSAKKKGEKTMKIRKSNKKARKSFRARHNCDNPGPKTKARYWSCKKW